MSKAQLRKLIETSTPEEMLAHLEYLHSFERWAVHAKKALEQTLNMLPGGDLQFARYPREVLDSFPDSIGGPK